MISTINIQGTNYPIGAQYDNEGNVIADTYALLDNVNQQINDLKTLIKLVVTGGANTATNVTYNNDNSGLNAENVQDAIDEVSSIGHFAKRGGIVNISTNYNSTNTAEVLTLKQAIAKVPLNDRVLGFKGRFLTVDGWRTYTFTGDVISEWNNVSKWSLPITTSEEVIDLVSGKSMQEVIYKYITSNNKSVLQYLPSIKELYIDKSEYTTPEIPIYLRAIYRAYIDSSGRTKWIIQFTRNNTTNEVVCNAYYYSNIENNEVLEIVSTGTYGNVYGYIVLDWSKFPINVATVLDGKLLDDSFELKNSLGIYNYIKNKSNESEINTLNQHLQTKKTDIIYIEEDSIYFNNIIKELYIDKSNYIGENDIYLRLIRKEYPNPEGKSTWVIQFVNGNTTNVVCQVYGYDDSIESETVNIIKSSNLYGNVSGYAVINWDMLDSGSNIFVDKKVLNEAFDIKNSPIINSYINNTSLQDDLKNQENKINLIKSSPIFINEKTVLYNNAIKELYIDKTNYIGSKPIYFRGIYRGYVSDSNPRIRWIIQFAVGDSTSIVCQYYQYDSTDESQLILPITSSGNFGDVAGYIILDWNQFADGEYTHVNKELTEAAFNIKNSPIIKEYIDNKQLQEEDWKEYPTLNVFEKGYLPNSGNGFALLNDRDSNISYSVHPKVLDKSNNINTKFSVYISMLEDETGNITEDSVLYLFDSVLKNHNYNRIWLALGASLYYKIGRRDSSVSYENCANGHVVTIPDEDVSTLGLISNKAAIWYPLSWHNKLMSSSEHRPYIQIYNDNTINDSEEGILYKYEIDWRNKEAVSLFKEMLNTVSSVFNNKVVNGIILRKYISVLEISFINNWGEGSLIGFGTKIPEYNNLDCLKEIVETYKKSFPDILLAAPALSMQNRNNAYTDAMKDFAIYLATTTGNNASKELGVFMDNVGFFSTEKTTYSLRHNGIYVLDAIKNKRKENKGIYVGELANTMGYWSSELKNDWLPYSIKELGLSMFNHDIRPGESYIIQTGINYVKLIRDSYDKAGYRFYIIGNRSYYTRKKNNLLVNAIFWIGNMGYSNLYHKFWKPYVVIRTEQGEFVNKIPLTNLELTKINHSDWNIGIEYTTPYRKLNMSVDVTSYPTNTKFNLFFAVEDSDNISDNMCLSITGRNNNNEYLIYNEGYNIIYNTYDGVNSEFNPTQYYPCRENVKLFPAIHDSKIFMGWYLDANFENKINEIDVSNNRGDINLYAKFS